MEGIKRGKSMVTRATQFAWLEQKDGPPKYTQRGMPLERKQPARSNWLQDGGLGEDNLYYLCCSICSTKVAACKFQSPAQNIKTHGGKPASSACSTEMARDLGQEGCVARFPGSSCTALRSGSALRSAVELDRLETQ